MGNVSFYHRSPLMDTGFAPMADSSVSGCESFRQINEKVLAMVDRSTLSPFDAVLATKLGGYKHVPEMDISEAFPDCQNDLTGFTEYVRALEMVSVMNRDRNGLIRVLGALQSFKRQMEDISEKDLFENGAELWRLLTDLYRRTNQSFLLDVMKELRSRLPDVSGVMHRFPFPAAFQKFTDSEKEENRSYCERMERLATTRYMADSVAMTAMISQYSGDKRDIESPRFALDSLKKYHVLPGGAISGDPFLSGSSPLQPAELCSVCAQMEAWYDAFLFTGDAAFAEQMEMLYENYLCDFVQSGSVNVISVPDRLFTDESCEEQAPLKDEISALLRALYAMRRSVWLWKDDRSVCCAQPYSGICTFRVDGKTIRLSADVSGFGLRTMKIRIETKEPVSFALSIRVPSYCKRARMRLNGNEIEPDFRKSFATIDRNFCNGDTISLDMELEVRMEKGWRDTASVYLGPWLMALPIPSERTRWQFALEVNQRPELESLQSNSVLVKAGLAEKWTVENGLIAAPPRGVKLKESFQLKLQPSAGLKGRISAFPCITE